MLFPDFDGPNQSSLENLIDQAKTRRAQYFRENSQHLLPMVGLVTAVLGLTFILGPRSAHALKAATYMERLATTLHDGEMITPNIARGISRLLREPGYNCNNLACDTALEHRNHAIRRELRVLFSKVAAPHRVAVQCCSLQIHPALVSNFTN
jgi:hypothetical protein